MKTNGQQPIEPVIGLASSFRHFEYDDPQLERAKDYLRQLWELVMIQGAETTLQEECLDRCSEGGFAIHLPVSKPTTLNCFIKKAPSLEWAKQAYEFSKRYAGKSDFRMAKSARPFVYDDGNLVLYVTDFVPGLDLDRLFLMADRSAERAKYVPYVEAIGNQSLDDLVFWQADSPSAMAHILHPSALTVISDFKDKILLAFQNAKDYGSLQTEDGEQSLLEKALMIFDNLTLSDAGVVPILDNCPKNQGIQRAIDRYVVNPTMDDIIEEISTKSKPDLSKIRTNLYHWDPAAKWGHFLEDFFAFFDSYEFGRFAGEKGITTLDDRYKDFLDAKYDNDPRFRAWVGSLKIHTSILHGEKGGLASHLVRDRYLIQFYRATRKADLTLTKYALKNERVVQQRSPALYRETRELLSKQIDFYSGRAVQAIRDMLTSLGNDGEQTLNEFEEIKGLGVDNKQLLAHVNNEFGKVEFRNDTRMPIVCTLGLLYIAYRFAQRKIDYGSISNVEDSGVFGRLVSGR